MDFDLSHVDDPAILMITDDRYLNHECPNGPIIDVLIGITIHLLGSFKSIFKTWMFSKIMYLNLMYIECI